MHIKSLRILDGMSTADFRFSKSKTLITSSGVNSVGKTSLVRLILYSLGAQIPSMQGFPFKKLATRLEIDRDGVCIVLIRNDASIRVVEGCDKDHYALPYDFVEVTGYVFGEAASKISGNLLGCFYIDQDKGWTLLNRGKAIGNVSFSIDSLISGISDVDESAIRREIDAVERSIEKYKLASDIAGYKQGLGLSCESQRVEGDASRAEERRLMLTAKKNALSRTLRGIRRSQKDNDNFRKYVNNMKLRVRLDDGEVVTVTSDKLVGFNDNTRYIDARAAVIRADIAELDRQLSLLGPLEEDDEALFKPDSPDLFDRQVATLNLDGDAYSAQIESLKARKKKLKERLSAPVGERKGIYDEMNALARSYCSELGVGGYFEQDAKGILTSDLKSKSGSCYHLLVFAFRLTYAKIAEKSLGINLPLIIDSPHGRELSEENFRRCMDLLEKEFSNHQIIIASVDPECINADVIISLEDRLMSAAELIPDFDIGEWERCEDAVWTRWSEA